MDNNTTFTDKLLTSFTTKIVDVIGSMADNETNEQEKIYQSGFFFHPNDYANEQVQKTEDGFIITVDLPYVDGNDVNVVVKETYVEINSYHGEIEYDIDIPVPSPLDVDQGNATFNNGVLKVYVENQ